MVDNRFLWDFCTAPMSVCEIAQLDCNQCNSHHKKDAEQNKLQGKPARPIAQKNSSKGDKGDRETEINKDPWVDLVCEQCGKDQRIPTFLSHSVFKPTCDICGGILKSK